MRSCYADLARHAIADLVDLGDSTWLITRITVAEQCRGTGAGSRLLERVIADADAEGVTLALLVVPHGRGGLTREQLAKWYARHGFKVANREGRMRRTPR